MKNVQKPEKIHLGRLIKEIGKGRFVIPDFQREFDWHPKDVRELLKSIFSDYYIGTLLLWEGNKENYEKMGCANLYAFEKEADPEYIVLDGQQRLSALHYAFFQPNVQFRNRKNRVYYFLRINELLNEEFEEAFFYTSSTKRYDELVENKEKQFEEHIFHLGVMQQGSWGIEKWLKAYNNYWEEKAEQETKEELKEKYLNFSKKAEALKDFFEDLLDNYQVSYISLSRELGLNKVCDIFTHINSKGKPLDTFDLLNSITRKESIFLKDLYRESSGTLDDTNYPGYEMKTQIMMVMSILKQNYCSAKYLYYLVPNEIKKVKNADGRIENQVLIQNKEEFETLWETAVRTIRKTLNSLKNPREFGAINNRFLPYPSIIPVLSAIKCSVKTSNATNKTDIARKIKKWYWASIFLNRYSSSVETTSAKDYIDLKKWFVNEDAELDGVSEFIGTYKNLDLQKETNSGSAIYKAVFNLIIINGARDWHTYELPEYDDLDDHHIVPKSWGKKVGIPKEVNSILNRVPLSSETNRKILRDHLPNIYLKELFANNNKERVYQVLASHLISKKAVEILLRENFTVDDYYEFLTERRDTIINEIQKTIVEDKIDLPEDLQKLDSQIEGIEMSFRKLIEQSLSLKDNNYIKEILPAHIVEKMSQKIKRERKRNPAQVEENFNKASFWLQFTDLQKLLQIVSSKTHWTKYETMFGTKEKLNAEFTDMANLRNALRHSREVDKITRMKGEASILWLEQQLKFKNA